MSFAADPLYNEAISVYFAETPQIGEEVWQRFTTYVQPSLSSNPTFAQFLDTYIAQNGATGTLEDLTDVTTLPTGIYETYLDYYFSDRTSDDQLSVWKAFLALEGYPNNTEDFPSTAELASPTLQNAFGTFAFNVSTIETNILASLTAFLQRYNAYDFSQQALSLTQVTSIPGGFYANYIASFFGGRTEIEPFDIWRSFLVSINYPLQTPSGIVYEPSAEDLASPVMEAAFAQYMNAIRDKELFFSSTTSSSPNESQADFILYSVMGSLENMLNTIEQVVINQSDTLIFLGEKQQEYTKMMSRVPNLVATDASGDFIGSTCVMVVPPIAKLEDPSSWFPNTDFTFGYDQISLQEVSDWGVATCLATPGTTCQYQQYVTTEADLLTSANPQDNIPLLTLLTLSFVTNVDATEKPTSITVTFTVSPGTGISAQGSQTVSLFGSNGVPLDQADLDADVATAWQNIFAASAASGVVSSLNGQIANTGRYLSTSQDDVQARTEQNTILQQYINNIRSLRAVVTTNAQNVQGAVNATKDAINNHTDIWTAILETMNAIVHAIFKKK